MPPSPPSSARHGGGPPSPTVSVVIPALNEEGDRPQVPEGRPRVPGHLENRPTPWSTPAPGAHRAADIDGHDIIDGHDTGMRRSGIYDTRVRDAGVRRSGLYDTGVHRVGVYDSGVHRTDVYDTGVHHLPDDQDGPLYRQTPPREVGGGRRRLDAGDRRTDGGTDLTVVPGEDREPDGRRPGHRQALPGERFAR